jgi:hypothetical protein
MASQNDEERCLFSLSNVKSSRKFNLFFSDLFLSKFYFLTFSFPSPHIPSFSNAVLYRVGMDMNLGIFLGRSDPYSLGIGFGHGSGDITIPWQGRFKLSLYMFILIILFYFTKWLNCLQFGIVQVTSLNLS